MNLINEIKEKIKLGKLDELESLIDKSKESIPESDLGGLYQYMARAHKDKNTQKSKKFCELGLKINPKSYAFKVIEVSHWMFGDEVSKLKKLIDEIDYKSLDENILFEYIDELSRVKQHELAYEVFTYAYDKYNNDKNRHHLLRASVTYSDLNKIKVLTEDLRKKYTNGNYSSTFETPRTHLIWCDDPQINYQVIKNYVKKQKSEIIQLNEKQSNKKKIKIRVGYISHDFRDHATSLLFLGLLRNHNRDIFEIYGYCTSFDDGSVMRREVVSRFDKFTSINQISSEQIVNIIKNDDLDILVDLNGLTKGNKLGLFVNRFAKVQISYLGFPGTVAYEGVDYIIADSHVIPVETNNMYEEKIIRIPWTYQSNDYLAKYLPPKSKLPENLSGNVILGVFNNLNKINKEMWTDWMEILRIVPKVKLWMLASNQVAINNLKKYAIESEIELDKIVIAPRLNQEKHFARLQNCHLMLDTFPYGGHTSTSDAIFCGVPVLSLCGKNFSSRVSAGLLKAAYLDEFICNSRQDYIKKAIQYCQKIEYLNEIKKTLIEKRSTLPIFDAISRARHIETAYIAALNLKNKQQPNKHIFVGNKNKDGSR